MAPGAEEALPESGSATTAGTSSGRRQREVAEDGLCPICLDSVDDTAHVGTCLHTFCFACIRQWAAVRATCPLCRQRFTHILHAVRADDDYREYVVGTPGQRGRDRSPQWRYHLRPRPHGNPAVGNRAPAQRDRGRAPRPSDTSAP